MTLNDTLQSAASRPTSFPYPEISAPSKRRIPGRHRCGQPQRRSLGGGNRRHPYSRVLSDTFAVMLQPQPAVQLSAGTSAASMWAPSGPSTRWLSSLCGDGQPNDRRSRVRAKTDPVALPAVTGRYGRDGIHRPGRRSWNRNRDDMLRARCRSIPASVPAGASRSPGGRQMWRLIPPPASCIGVTRFPATAWVWVFDTRTR